MRRIAAAALLALMLITKQNATAQTAIVINLSCNGTMQIDEADTQPVSKMEIVVDLGDHTIAGFGIVARITDVDAVNINFGGPQIDSFDYGFNIGITGNINRLTGHINATTIQTSRRNADARKVVVHYDLLCKATNRVF